MLAVSRLTLNKGKSDCYVYQPLKSMKGTHLRGGRAGESLPTETFEKTPQAECSGMKVPCYTQMWYTQMW